MSVQIQEARLWPLAQLRPNPDNPKKPMGRRYLAGLRASIARYGFCGVLQVGTNLDGTATVLDGNTRLEELDQAGVVEALCQAVPACAEGADGWQQERRAFVLAHDRNRKVFDEDAVLEQLRDLSAAGQDVAALSRLTSIENLQRILSESGQAATRAATASAGKVAAQSSLVLYGPAEDVEAVRQLLRRIKKRFGPVFKLRSTLEQAEQYEALDDEGFLLAFAAALERRREDDHA